MSARSALVALAVLMLVVAAAWLVFERQLSGTWFAFGVHPDVLSFLDRSLEDQKSLARLDPGAEPVYRQRFDEIEVLRRHLRILERNRQAIIRRYETILFALFGLVLLGAGAAYGLREMRDRQRLARLRLALEDLCGGRIDIHLGEAGRDAIGRVAKMIESTSQVMARDRRRLQALENLSAWQEAARRHAHEMRTPLTAARLELERLGKVAAGLDAGRLDAGRREVTELAGSLGQELERLAAFTRSFTSFARLPRPRPSRQNLGEVASEFVGTFAQAWPNLSLGCEPPPAPSRAFEVEVDREMLRQVLVNLCDNSSHAVADRTGRVTLRLSASDDGIALEVADDGPGIPAEVRRRVFEPYATTRKVGEGMGLGLAISKKILLDHGGDLDLVRTSPAGTVFRLLFPLPAATRTETMGERGR